MTSTQREAAPSSAAASAVQRAIRRRGRGVQRRSGTRAHATVPLRTRSAFTCTCSCDCCNEAGAAASVASPVALMVGAQAAPEELARESAWPRTTRLAYIRIPKITSHPRGGRASAPGGFRAVSRRRRASAGSVGSTRAVPCESYSVACGAAAGNVPRLRERINL